MFLMSLAGLVWLVFQRANMARRLAELERLPARLAQLVMLVRSISAADWNASATTLLQGIVGTGGIQYAALLGISDANNLELRVTQGEPQPGYDPCNDPEAVRARQASLMVTDPVAGVAYIPVVEESQVVGMLVVRGGSLVGVQVHPGDLDKQPPLLLYLAAAAELTGVALAGIQAFQKQAALSHTDGLTGLFNHRHFHHAMGVQIAQMYLLPQPMSLILLDIDHFKKVNDTYGHLTGDLVLREVGNLMRRRAPTGAVAARYGGEEFAILLPGTGLQEAAAIGEQLRLETERHVVFDYATGNRINVTISLGVGEFRLGLGKSQFINLVDSALYTSKHAGRNRVTIAETGLELLEPEGAGQA